jgi:hypothetical protein
VSYLDQNSRNWGVLIATALAVPVALAWSVVMIVGGSLVCASTDGPCSPSVVHLIVGLLLIAAIASGLGWLINRIVALAKND